MPLITSDRFRRERFLHCDILGFETTNRKCFFRFLMPWKCQAAICTDKLESAANAVAELVLPEPSNEYDGIFTDVKLYPGNSQGRKQ